MKRLLLLVPIFGLAACAGQQRPPVDPPASVQAWDNPPSAGNSPIRQPGRLHTYFVNNYIDPNNPRLRHRAHLVDVVEQDERWNLAPTDATETNLGPVTAVNDPNAAPNPYTAEFETELMQQRDQSKQLADLAARMTAQMAKLQEVTEKSAAVSDENASLHQRLDQLQKDLDAVKTPPPPPVHVPAPKKSSWLDSIRGMLRRPPVHDTPVTLDKPSFRPPVVALRPAEAPFPAPGLAVYPEVLMARADLPSSWDATPQATAPHFTARTRSHPSRNDDDLPPLPQP